MIGKVIRGNDARRLLYYLYGPGRANEHADPHLVAGFSDPADLEPPVRPDGSRDFRRLAGLLAQPLAALAGPGHDRPVWHCSVRAAPGDRHLSDAEWAQVAARVMDQAGLAPDGDDLAVRWVAVRHAADHVHIVATLARQDGGRPRVWNDFYRVREACQAAERELGLARTAPADRTAARGATRAEAEQAARRGWPQVPRARLRREVQVAAGGAGSEEEFFARLRQAGVLVRLRHSTTRPSSVTGYAVGLPGHAAKDGGVIWYGGGKLAADLTLPRLRHRWAGPGRSDPLQGKNMPSAAARAVLRKLVTEAARQADGEPGFFAALGAAGVEVRLRFSETSPGQVTGYAVTLPGHGGADGTPQWYGGGRLTAGLTLPRLRQQWARPGGSAPGRSGAFRFTAPERAAIYAHAARQAAMAAEHVRRCARDDPDRAADAAWAAADALNVAGRALLSRELRRAAAAYDRATRPPHGRIPPPAGAGGQLRAAARLLAMLGGADGMPVAGTLIASLAGLTAAVAELREAQLHAWQAASARAAAEHMHAAREQARAVAPALDLGAAARRPGPPGMAPGEFPREAGPYARASHGAGDVPRPRAVPHRDATSRKR